MKNLTIEKHSDNFIRFRLANVNLAYANTLRRTIIAEVPTMAIEFVKIHENTSPLHDEFLAHRLGLIPLVSNTVESFNYYKECLCTENSDVCPVCSVKFILKKHNDTEEIVEVTTNDLIQVSITKEHQKNVIPVDFFIENKNGEKIKKPILLMKLGRNQQIDLECIAKKGQGKEHTKWSPVSLCAMKFEPKVSVNPEKQIEISPLQKQKLVESCPRKVFEYDERKNEVRVINQENCVFCEECVSLCKEWNIEDLVKVEDGDYIFEVETSGSLTSDDIIASAFDRVDDILKNLEDSLANIDISK